MPRQRGHGCCSANSPCDVATTPRPPHSGQRFGAVPGLAPVPWQVWQASSSSTGTVVWRPLSASSNETRTVDLDVVAALAALRGCCCRPPPPRAEQAAEEVAEVEVAEVDVVAGQLRAGRSVEPNESYCLRFSGSESTS